MSFIVKGMEMPDNCVQCPCSNDESRYCRAANEYIPMLGKPEFCPLHPLPVKHGRLIDAKALDFAFTDLRFNDDGTLRHWDARKNWCLHGSEVESLIENAETIVEAEA